MRVIVEGTHKSSKSDILIEDSTATTSWDNLVAFWRRRWVVVMGEHAWDDWLSKNSFFGFESEFCAVNLENVVNNWLGILNAYLRKINFWNEKYAILNANSLGTHAGTFDHVALLHMGFWAYCISWFSSHAIWINSPCVTSSPIAWLRICPWSIDGIEHDAAVFYLMIILWKTKKNLPKHLGIGWLHVASVWHIA